MADLSVSPEGLRAASAALTAESRRIETALISLETEADRLRNNWDGAAKAAYDAAQREWSATFAEMKDTLAAIAAATGRIADDYVDADRRSAKLFQR